MQAAADGASRRLPAKAGEVPSTLREAASTVFGDRLPLARRYAEQLALSGVQRGLIGPHEVPRLWDRHLLNCGVVAELVEPGAVVCDVGSGAGLPGVALAIARPDLDVTLLEPSARRVAFLEEVVATLGLDGARVVRGRAEEVVGRLRASVVTARAVAPLDRLAGWCLPLTAPGGCVLALKGRSAADEVARTASAVRRAGGTEVCVVQCGIGVVAEPTTVVQIHRGDSGAARARRAR